LYRFQLYSDPTLTTLTASTLTADTQWPISFNLQDNSTYYWRAQAEDIELVASAWSNVNQFYVNENNIDDAPQFNFLLPNENIELTTTTLELQWVDSDPDSSALIDLYYVDSNGIASLIVAGLSEDLDGDADVYTWDVSGLAPGVYTLQADIVDSSSSISVNGCCTLTVPVQQKHITVTELTPLTTSETGEAWVEVQVTLDQPLQAGKSLMLSFSSSDTTELLLLNENYLPAVDGYLSFTESNWNQPQNVLIKGVDDCEIDGDQTVSMMFATVVSDDPAYDGLVIDSIDITNTDNEVEDQTLFICDYQVVSETPVAGSSLVDTEYRPLLLNTSSSLTSASAQLTLIPSSNPNASLSLQSSGVVEFTSVLINSNTTSDNTIVLSRDPAQILDTAKLAWLIAPGNPLSDSIEGDDGNNTLTGTSGNDVIEGKAGDDTIRGGEGDDTIIGGSGADRMLGEMGNDLFIIEGSDPYADIVNGGGGYDVIQGGVGNDAIRLSSIRSVEEIDGRAGINTIYGTAGDDTLVFANTILRNIDLIDALGGDDVVQGSQGDDVIKGNAGSDILYGHAGNDIFLSEGSDAGADRFYGGDGMDQILGGEADDVLRLTGFYSSDAVEVIDLGAGSNTIEGSNANNRLDFTNTTLNNVQYIDGLAGNDHLRGSESDDLIIGNLGSDSLYGNGGNDTFRVTNGDTGFDLYHGGDGTDTISGTPLDDTLRMSRFVGDDTVEIIDGDGGINTIVGSSGKNILNFTDTELISINYIDGGEGDDKIYGSSVNDFIIGGLGSDTLYGNGGDDVFEMTAGDTSFDYYNGGDGTDQINATEGDDVIQLFRFNGDYTVEIINGLGGNNIITGDHKNNHLNFSATQLNDIGGIYGLDGNDTLRGSPMDDVITGGEGNDRLYGQEGDDLFHIEGNYSGFDVYVGGDGNDRIVGTNNLDVFRIHGISGIEIIDGLDGNNVIQGSDTSNILDFTNTQLIAITAIYGGMGNDLVRGSAANDMLIGGQGSDRLYGNGGDDIFVLAGGDERYDRYFGGDGFDTLVGTEGDDLFRLNRFDKDQTVERIDGGGGNDRIVAGGGNNRLDFTNTELIGIQTIEGNGGVDIIFGSDQDNVIIGGLGRDTLFGNGGDDRFLLTPGDTDFEVYSGGEGIDTVEGTDGDDVFRIKDHRGIYTVDIIDGQGGTNIIESSPKNNFLDFRTTQLIAIISIDGKEGNDTIMGGEADDLIIGGLGSDRLYGNGGNDRFLLTEDDTGYDIYNGGDGNDVIEGTDEDDVLRLSNFKNTNKVEVIDGGSGINLIEGSGASNTLDFSTTQLINIASIAGMTGNDTLLGSAAGDVIIGGPGNDNLSGLNGADIYLININEGIDNVMDNGDDNAQDVIRFDNSATPADLWLHRDGNELSIYRLGADNRVRIPNFYSDTKYLIELIAIDGGLSLETSAFNDLVDLMTSIGKPVGGNISLTPEQQQQVNDAIGATWQ
jgi:Ca2+-binding RTX toxin-like protein